MQGLRPLERRIRSWVESGSDLGDIARRFRRSPEFIERVLVLSGLERSGQAPASALRPLERRILRWRERGASFDDIARRFRRSPAFVERVVAYTQLKAHGTGGT